MSAPDPFRCAAFLVLAFCLAGVAQALWLRSALSARLGVPLDGHRTLRGRRLLGDNKTWRGFVVMVPAVGAAFWLLHLLGVFGHLWPLSAGGYGLLGCWVGFGFMAGELPNSFLKRQLGIAPGAAPDHPLGRPVCFLLDRLDSLAGGCLALGLVVRTPLLTWLYLLLVAPAIHWSFSLLLFHFGVKARPA